MNICIKEKHLPMLASDPQNHFTIRKWRPVFLLPKIDEEETKKRADLLLKQYRTFVRLADEEYEPKITTTYSLSPRSVTNQVSRQVENAVVLKVTAQEEIVKINRAINKLNAYDRQRLFDKYISRKEYSDKKLIMDLCESEGGYYKKLKKALLRFAEAYSDGELLTFENEDSVCNLFRNRKAQNKLEMR